MALPLPLTDLAHYAAASLIATLLLLGPGFGIVALGVRSGLLSASNDNAPWAWVLALATLPAIDALLVRWSGMAAMLVLHLGLGIIGAPHLVRRLRNIRARWYLIALAWWAILGFAYVDVQWEGRLYQSLAVLDLVKHAIVVRTIAHDGLPLQDMFFLRPGPAGYYYYFYLGPALIHWLAREAIDARMAFVAAAFVTGIAFIQLILLAATRAALLPVERRERFVGLALLLCAASGLDVIPSALGYFANGIVPGQLDWWGEETRWALTSILWVPHHVAALVAIMVGALALVEGAAEPASMQRRLAATGIAGLAFATAFGSSIWIALVAAAILPLWWLAGLRRPAMPSLWMLPASAAVALVLVLPQLHDLIVGRVAAAFPLALYVRPFGQATAGLPSAGQALVALAMLPATLAIEFGLFALGAAAFVASGRARVSWANPVGRLFLIAALVSLVAACFIRSTVINNDFGWRAIWFAQFTTLAWTAALMTEDRDWLRGSAVRIAALLIGLSATAYDVIALRLIRRGHVTTQMGFINAHPEIDAALRQAYIEMDRTVPTTAIVQHNPAERRVFDFGLYGHHRVTVADGEAQLFGADPGAVAARVARLAPLFERAMPFEEVRTLARAQGIDMLVLTQRDPVWQSNGGAPKDWPCRLRSRQVCIAAVTGWQGGRR